MSSPFTRAQEAVVTFIPLFGGVLSLVGSSILIRLMVRQRCRLPYRRILFLMSCYDVINTVTIILGPFMFPADTAIRRWAVGTDRTCVAVGFLIQVAFVPSFTYYGILSVYYACRIRFNIKDAFFGRRIEPVLHFLTIGFNLVSAIVYAALGLFGDGGPYTLSCWLVTNSNCDRQCVKRLRSVSSSFLFLVALVVIVCNGLIYQHVRSSYSRSQFLTNRASGRALAVAKQSFLYVLVYLVTYVWVIVATIVVTAGMEQGWLYKIDLYPIIVLRSITITSMGFGNCLVYATPRYQQVRNKFPRHSRWWALHLVLVHDGEMQTPSADDFTLLDPEEVLSGGDHSATPVLVEGHATGTNAEEMNLSSERSLPKT